MQACNRWPDYPAWTGPTINPSEHPDLVKAVEAIRRLDSGNAECVILAGSVGCGKTLLANIYSHSQKKQYSIDGEIVNVGQPARLIFKTEPALLEEIRSTYGKQHRGTQKDADQGKIIRQCSNTQNLIIDDIGIGHVKADSMNWYYDICWQLFNDRTGKRTLITTNLTPAELAARVGTRSMSRLKGLMGANADEEIAGCENFVSLFEVPDYRGKNWVMGKMK
ncbi:MAG: ATP-binding protein [Chloroflexi bacterium]|nr:ATP-binding protein [Chloroflexota bacterium]